MCTSFFTPCYTKKSSPPRCAKSNITLPFYTAFFNTTACFCHSVAPFFSSIFSFIL